MTCQAPCCCICGSTAWSKPYEPNSSCPPKAGGFHPVEKGQMTCWPFVWEPQKNHLLMVLLRLEPITRHMSCVVFILAMCSFSTCLWPGCFKSIQTGQMLVLSRFPAKRFASNDHQPTDPAVNWCGLDWRAPWWILVTCCDDSLHALRHRFTAFTGKVAKNHGLLSLDHGSRWCSINVACPLRKVIEKNFQRLEVPQCWSWFWLIAVAHCSHHFPSPGRYGEAHPWSGDLNMLDLRCHGAYYTSAKAYDLYT